MNYVKYSRNMIMLEDQSSDFSTKEGPVKGHLKVETGNNKGALRCSVHNLRPYSRGEYIYKLIFFGKKEERTIHAIVGNLVLNRNGSGETYFRFNPQDLDGKGNEYADFTTAIVAAVSTSNEKEPLHPVLKGLTGNEPAQRSYSGSDRMAAAAGVSQEGYDREERTPPASEEDTPAAAEAENVRPIMAEDPGESMQSSSEPMQPEQTQRYREPVEANPVQQQRPEPKTPSAPPASVREEEARAAARQPATEQRAEQNPPAGRQRQEIRPEQPKTEAVQGKKCRTFNHFYNQHLLNACNHSCRSAEFYEEVKPFADDRTGARWKKIVNIKNLPLVSPGAQYFASQYQHYLFGAKPDKDGYACRYFFAIPGRYSEAECPDGGKSGFVYWQPVHGATREKNAYGYWIVAVNAENGDVEAVE